MGMKDSQRADFCQPERLFSALNRREKAKRSPCDVCSKDKQSALLVIYAAKKRQSVLLVIYAAKKSKAFSLSCIQQLPLLKSALLPGTTGPRRPSEEGAGRHKRPGDRCQL